MTHHDMFDISRGLTTDVFNTACVLQQQVYTLEERCRTSEEREESLRQRRTELQEILSMFATVERTEARATAELAQTLARVRSPRRSSTAQSQRQSLSPSYFKFPMETPPSHRTTQRGSWPSYRPDNSFSSPLARVARVALPPHSSSPRSPLDPRRLDADADPRMGGEGAASHPPGAHTSTPVRTSMVGAEAALMRALQNFMSDRERGVGQPKSPVCGGPGPQSTSVASVAGARERLGTPTRARRARLDPRQQTVTLGSHVVLPARSASDIAAISEPESDPGAQDGEYSPKDAAPSLPAALAKRLDEGVAETVPGRVDRLGEHEIAPAPEDQVNAKAEAGEPRARSQSVWELIKSVRKSGSVRDVAANVRNGGGGGYNTRKTRSPAHTRLLRARGKTSIIGVPDLRFRISWRRAPIAKRKGAGNHEPVDVWGEGWSQDMGCGGGGV
ncbi:hypothetical protein BV20DRAFT_983482 [Pilatotrama ljubarskyi]|nr:hypothetical protein BV20DRAFT_983482 [Pilatotrama ljubarskyi]